MMSKQTDGELRQLLQDDVLGLLEGRVIEKLDIKISSLVEPYDGSIKLEIAIETMKMELGSY